MTGRRVVLTRQITGRMLTDGNGRPVSKKLFISPLTFGLTPATGDIGFLQQGQGGVSARTLRRFHGLLYATLTRERGLWTAVLMKSRCLLPPIPR